MEIGRKVDSWKTINGYKIIFCMIVIILMMGLFGMCVSALQENSVCGAGGESIGMVNPAAIYCNELDYKYKIVDESAGQKGVCIFPDETECEEWQFLKGKCGQTYSYCEKYGYDIKTLSDGQDPLSKEYAVCFSKEGDKRVLKAVLDYELCRPWDKNADFCHLFLKSFPGNPELEEAFFKGYNEFSSLDASFDKTFDFYMLNLCISVCSWAKETAPEYYNKALNKLKFILNESKYLNKKE